MPLKSPPFMNFFAIITNNQKYMKTKTILNVLFSGLLINAGSLHATDCPCDGGTAEFSVDCSGDGTPDACSSDDCPPCSEKNPNPSTPGYECCGEEEYDPQWKGMGIAHSFTADPALVGKINTAVNLIPLVTVNLDSVKGTVSGDKRDCCKLNSLQSDGVGYAQGSLTVKGNLKDLTIFGPPTVTRKYDFTVVEVDIQFNVGAKLTADLSVDGTGGSRWDNCSDESCNYGSFNVNTSLSVDATIQVIACVETWFTSKRCVDIEATPATISISLTGSITSGDKDTCLGGVQGTVNLSNIKYSAIFRVSEYEISYSRDIYPAS